MSMKLRNSKYQTMNNQTMMAMNSDNVRQLQSQQRRPEDFRSFSVLSNSKGGNGNRALSTLGPSSATLGNAACNHSSNVANSGIDLNTDAMSGTMMQNTNPFSTTLHHEIAENRLVKHSMNKKTCGCDYTPSKKRSTHG